MENKTLIKYQSDLEIDNLPNRITILRICLIPIIFTCLFLQTASWPFPLGPEWKSTLGWASGWTFVIASFTDWVDGYIARKNKIETIFGSFLDPIADKFLVVSALILLEALGRINALVVTILVLREIYMTSLRLLASHEGLRIPVNGLGKWKTATQMMGIPMLMAYEKWWIFPFPEMGTYLLYTACILSLYSAIHYSFGIVKNIKISRVKKLSEFKKKLKLERLKKKVLKKEVRGLKKKIQGIELKKMYRLKKKKLSLQIKNKKKKGHFSQGGGSKNEGISTDHR